MEIDIQEGEGNDSCVFFFEVIIYINIILCRSDRERIFVLVVRD